jgi:hypothetical protein
MNHRPTSFLLRDKITFSEYESRKLRRMQKLQKLQKHLHERRSQLLPEFNYGTDETQTEIIPDIEPEIIPDIQPPIVMPTPFVIAPQLLTPDLPPKFRDLTSNPINGGVRVDLTDLMLRRKTKGAPIDTRNVDSMMEDANEILAALGL